MREQYSAVIKLYRTPDGDCKAEAGGAPMQASPVSAQRIATMPPERKIHERQRMGCSVECSMVQGDLAKRARPAWYIEMD